MAMAMAPTSLIILLLLSSSLSSDSTCCFSIYKQNVNWFLYRLKIAYHKIRAASTGTPNAYKIVSEPENIINHQEEEEKKIKTKTIYFGIPGLDILIMIMLGKCYPYLNK